MKVTRQQIRKLLIEVINIKEIKDSDIKKAVVLCLKREGGAAGIDLLIKSVKALETKRKKLPKNLKNKKSIARHILRMEDILKHRNGDIILKIGLPKR